MNLHKKLGLKVLGLVVFSLLLAVNCAEEGTAPTENIPPNTFITNYRINLSPDSATAYNATIYWSGNDVDGAVFWYDWRIINADGDSLYWEVEDEDGNPVTVNISTWQHTNTLTEDIILNYPTFDTKYLFYVRAQDNDREFDPTPAVDTISIDRIRDFNYAPNTEVVEGPGNGDVTTTGIHFVIRGRDIDGAVDTIEYKLDTDADWTKAGTDVTTSTLTIDITGIPAGARTVSFRSIDNFRKTDPTPVSRSIFVDPDLRPDLTVVSGPIPNAYYYLPAGGTTLDLAATWSGSAAWYYSTIEYRYAVDDSSTWSDWMAETSDVLDALAAGDHEFFVQGRDLGGGITTYHTEFAVGAFVGDQGILLVNGIHKNTYDDPDLEFTTFWTNVGLDFEFDFWDTFSGQNYSALPELEAALIGEGAIPGSVLGNYSSMVMIMNAFNGDLEVYDAMFPLIMSYLNAGGNVFLGSRQGSDFIRDDLEEYAHVEDWDGELVNLSPGITAVAEGLIDIPGAGLSRADIPVLPTDPEVTLLFTHPGFPNAACGIYVQPAAGGNFVFVAGRPYRYEAAPYGANVNYIVANYFGEQ